MLRKYCTQYASKFGKLSSGHRTRKVQSQRKAMPKNVQTTAQLHSFHMLARWCSKSFKLGFNSIWTKKFQMYKLDLENTEKPEIKLSTSVGSEKKLLLLLLLSHFSRVRLFATPWIAAHQAFLFITISQSSLRLTSIESVMPSSHLILCCPLLLLSPNP